MRLSSKILFVAVAAVLSSTGTLSAEILELKSGHKISGEVISELKDGKKTFLVIKTEFGGTLKLEKNKFVKRYYGNDAIATKYKSLVSSMADSPDAHWEIYAWCKEQGSTRFRNEMGFHLQQIIRLDSSDKKARSLLGYRQSGGGWVHEDRMLSERGYEKVGGKWVSKLQASVNTKKETLESEFNAKRTALSKWRRNTLGKKPEAQVRSELLNIVDKKLISILASKDYLGKAKNNPKLRMLFLEGIDHAGGTQAHTVLVKSAITDSNAAVRDLATSLLLNADKYNLANAVSPASIYLTSNKNSQVLRAATLLEQIKSPAAILPLMGSLVTKHKVSTGIDPNRSTFSQGTGGTSFTPGPQGPATVDVNKSNDQVRQALRTITKVDHGFDSAAWHEWYIREHTITEYDFRRDE